MRNARCSFMMSLCCDFISLLELHNFADQLRKLSLCALSQSHVEYVTSNSIYTPKRVSSSSFSSSSLTLMIFSPCDFISSSIFSMMNCERISRTNHVNYRCFHYHLNHILSVRHANNSIHMPERLRR